MRYMMNVFSVPCLCALRGAPDGAPFCSDSEYGLQASTDALWLMNFEKLFWVHGCSVFVATQSQTIGS